MTPKELFSHLIPVHREENEVILPTVSFKSIKRPLDGTPYMYQLGVSDTSKTIEIASVHKEFPDVPLTGDRRSGIIVHHGHIIIASFIIPGKTTHNLHEIIVRESYRKQGLGVRMIEQWFREVPLPTKIPRQTSNSMAVKTFLKAHENVVRWAIANGKDVPQKVIDAINEGKEKAEILAKVNLVENSPLVRYQLPSE
jgi:GNAT superfamily N-acetyltransferase